MERLPLCKTFELKTHTIDLFKTLSVYNFRFWFDGRRAVIPLYADHVAIVGIDGYVEIYGSTCEERVVDRIRWILGLDEDLGEFFSIASGDPLLHQFAEEFRGWRLRSSSLWWSLVIGVCQQNASFLQGWRMLANIVRVYGRKAVLENGIEVLMPPQPRDILVEPHKLIEARVGYRARTLQELARYLIEYIDEDSLLTLNVYDMEKELRRIRGVGSYTARLAIALAFRRYDLPPVDRWLRAIASRIYGIEEKAVEDFWMKRWKRWSALAAIATTIALDAEPLSQALKRIEQRILKPVILDKPTPSTLWKFEF